MFSMPCCRLRSPSDQRAATEKYLRQRRWSVVPRTFAVATSLALLSGCGAGSQGAPPGDASRASSRGRAQPPRAASTRQSSANLDPGSGATLERGAFVREVLQRNPSIDGAKSAWRAALARTEQQGAFEDPMVDLGMAPLSIGSSQARFGYEVGVSQKLPWFGKRSFERAAASAEAAAAKADYEVVRRELALAAVTLYDQYFVASRSLAINQQHIGLMQAMREAALAQFATGRGSAQDALSAEAELTHMEHDAVMLATQREVTVAQMNELLHRAPERPLPPPVAELGLPPAPDASPARLQAEALGQRPDIAAALERARAEQARAERGERESFPDVTLSTSYSTMWDMPEHRWMVGLGFNLPIQAATRGAATEEAHAMSAEFESDALRLSDAARTQVFVALKQLEAARHVLELYAKRLVPVALQQIDAARASFTSSQGSFSMVIDAERNLRRVELDYQLTRAEYGMRRAELDRALGRIPGLDWQEEAP